MKNIGNKAKVIGFGMAAGGLIKSAISKGINLSKEYTIEFQKLLDSSEITKETYDTLTSAADEILSTGDLYSVPAMAILGGVSLAGSFYHAFKKK